MGSAVLYLLYLKSYCINLKLFTDEHTLAYCDTGKTTTFEGFLELSVSSFFILRIIHKIMENSLFGS